MTQIDPAINYYVENTLDGDVKLVAETPIDKTPPYNYVDYSFYDGDVKYALGNDGTHVVLFSDGQEIIIGENPNHQTPATIENGKLYVMRWQDGKQEIVSYVPGESDVTVVVTLPEEALYAYDFDVDDDHIVVATWDQNEMNANREYWSYIISTGSWDK